MGRGQVEKKVFGLGEMTEPRPGSVDHLQRQDAVVCVCVKGILTLPGFRGTVRMGSTVGQPMCGDLVG